MSTKVPFAYRTRILGVLTLALAIYVGSTLAALQLNENQEIKRRAARALITRETLPAQRGIIMDRNDEILTHNIQRAQVIADRKHLRDLTVVLNSLAYNEASHRPQWNELDDAGKNNLYKSMRSKLEHYARNELSVEEKEAIRARIPKSDSYAHFMVDYDAKICELYFEHNDRLIAELLYPFLTQSDNEEPVGEEKPQQSRNLSRADIIEKIAQTETLKANQLAKAEGRPTRSLQSNIILARGISLETADKIRQALTAAKMRGVAIQTDLRRSYSTPDLLAHVLGYANFENKGMCGVEGFYQPYLMGVHGMREFRHSASGQVLPNEDDRYLPAKNGLNLRLTIDMKIQAIVEEELDRGMRHYNARKGCIIVVHPATGDILAMASRPAFDLNTKEIITPNGRFPYNNTAGPGKTRLSGDMNFATQAIYEPGSTFKVIAVATAVDKGIMSMGRVVSCDPFSVGGGSKAISDGRYRYSPMDLGGVLKKSSNPGTARIALACKWDNFKVYAKNFGIAQPTGICLPGSVRGRIGNGANLVNYSRISYGYTVSVTPLHMAMVYATIANDGVRMKPRLVDKIITSDGSVFDECTPVEAARVLKPATARALRQGLTTVTENGPPYGRGTAMAAAIPGFKVAGKTGTAKKSKPGGYYDNLYTVSFAAILPADKPELVIMTVIDEPRPTDCNPGGGTIAAPIFRATAERLIEALRLTPNDPEAYEKYLESKKATAKQ